MSAGELPVCCSRCCLRASMRNLVTHLYCSVSLRMWMKDLCCSFQWWLHMHSSDAWNGDLCIFLNWKTEQVLLASCCFSKAQLFFCALFSSLLPNWTELPSLFVCFPCPITAHHRATRLHFSRFSNCFTPAAYLWSSHLPIFLLLIKVLKPMQRKQKYASVF